MEDDAQPEASILWPPDVKNWLIGKDPDAGKDWRREGKGTTEDEMVGCHHRLDGHEFEQAPGVGDGQGGVMCCSPWGCKESYTTERLNWTDSLEWSQLRFLGCCWSGYYNEDKRIVHLFSDISLHVYDQCLQHGETRRRKWEEECNGWCGFRC